MRENKHLRILVRSKLSDYLLYALSYRNNMVQGLLSNTDLKRGGREGQSGVELKMISVNRSVAIWKKR